MEGTEVDIEYFAMELRKLAGSFQSGKGLKETKHEVDRLIDSIRNKLGPDKKVQISFWTALLHRLEFCNTPKADPRWIVIIRHANYRIKSRRYTAIHYRRRFK